MSTSTARVSPTSIGTSPRSVVILSRGTNLFVAGTSTFDFERGGPGTSTDADVWWQQVDSVTRYLVPQNGALLARLRTTELEVRSADELVSPPYDRLRIDGSSSRTRNQLTPGTVIAVRTRHGHYARMRIDAYGVDLFISWITYQ